MGNPLAWIQGRWFGMEWQFMVVVTEVVVVMEVSQ
jgi:hypothetical protein